VAERVAVNLKEAGIAVQLSGRLQATQPNFPLAICGWSASELLRRRLPWHSLHCWLRLESRAPCWKLRSNSTRRNARPSMRSASFRLVHVSESYGLSPQVRDWMPPRWGGWRLEDRLACDSAGARCRRDDTMSFRTKLLALFTVTIITAVTLVGWGLVVLHAARI